MTGESRFSERKAEGRPDSRFKRILYTSLVDVSLPNGPGVNERGFAKDMLARLGENFHAVIPRPVRGLPRELQSLSVTLLPSGRSVRTARGWAQSNLLGTYLLPRAIRRFRPELVVVRSGALAVSHYVTLSSIKVPYVVKTAGDVTFQSFYGRNALRRNLRGLNDHMFGRLLHGALCTDVVSPSQRDRAVRKYPDLASRIHVIDNGVDLDHFVAGEREAARRSVGFEDGDFLVGYVGNLPMQRGGKEVVDVVAGLRSFGNVKGLIVGDTGEAEACRRYAAERGVAEAVMVYGEADYGSVPRLMACMNVGLSILRSLERGNSEQKVRQYLATGLCVVGTSGSNDFLRGYEFARIVETEDQGEIADAVASFLEQGRAGMECLGSEARVYAESELSTEARNNQRIELWNQSGLPGACR